MRAFRFSRALYRLLLRAYPKDFRERFGPSLEDDFARILKSRGQLAGWRTTVADLRRSLPLTHASSHAEHRRATRVGVVVGHPGESSMGSVVFDLRHAVRGLIKAPVFTIVTVATLALGIGANTAIFSLMNAVLLRPMGYVDADRLMLIHEAIPQSNVPRFGVSPVDYLDLEQYQSSFAQIGVFRVRPFELAGSGEPEQVTALQMSSSVFPLLGVNAAVGRILLKEDEQQNQRVAVISHGLWQRRYGGRREVVGEQMTLDRQPYVIVGIMPPTFVFPKRGPYLNGQPADLWVPLVFNPFERQARGMFYNHSVIGRLRDGMSIEQATADVAALATRVHANYPAPLRAGNFDLQINATRFLDEVAGQVRRPLFVLLGAVGLVLLIACANVANLILSRAVARQREIGVRAALGAARHRLFQMLLLESLTLALVAGALGLALGFWVLRAVPAVITTSLPGVDDVTLDARVALFTFGLSVVTAVIFGTVPLAAGRRRELGDILRDSAARTTGGRGQHRVQAGLVVTSVAFAFVLLVGAGLLIRSFSTLTAIEHGVREDNVLTMQVALPAAGYREAGPLRAFYRNLHERLLAIPGVAAATIATDVPLKPDGERRAFTPDRQNDVGGLPPAGWRLRCRNARARLACGWH